MDANVTAVLVVVFLGLSAFFSSSETAFFALQQVRVHHLVESGAPGADRIARLKANPERFLATILLGNNLVNVALSSLATSLAFTTFGSERQGLAVAVATAVTTVGVVVLGEAVPKTVAARSPERVLFVILRPLEILQTILAPPAGILHAVSQAILRPFGKPSDASTEVSEEEIRSLVRMGASHGAVEETQAEIIHRTFEFGDMQSREIMTPRTEIVFVEQDATLDEFLKIYAGETHTRFPVYEREPDNVVGTLSVKDVLKAFAEGKLKAEDHIGSLQREAFFYPETMPIDDLFVQMRLKGTQMVLVIDEFGGIAGLLTVKQIVGEIVGSIIDEEEGEEPEVETIDERTFQVDASMRVDEANERLNLDLPDGDYETLAGFVLSSLGHIPKEGEQVRYNGLRLVVAEMKGVKIERILVTRSQHGSSTT